jgi:hypothetical protein
MSLSAELNYIAYVHLGFVPTCSLRQPGISGDYGVVKLYQIEINHVVCPPKLAQVYCYRYFPVNPVYD